MTDQTAADQIRQIVERVERIEVDIKGLQDDRKEIYAEAKANGFDVAALQEIVRLRKKDANDIAEAEAILETYKSAMGM